MKKKEKVTRAVLHDKLSANLGFSKKDSKEIIDEFFNTLAKCIKTGKLKISKFGNFEVKHKNARPGRNPKTKEEYQISARNVVSFKLSHTAKKKIEYEFLKRK